MSKVSVFKFRMNNQNATLASNIVRKFTETRGMVFYPEMKCFLTGNPNMDNTAKDTALSVGASIAASALTGGAVGIAYNTILRGLECQIVGDELILKAFIYSPKSKMRSIIHSTMNNTQAGALYYGDLKANLFKELQSFNIVLIGSDTEKIHDGAEARVLKKVFIIFAIMLAICAIAIYFVIQA